jgi:hypothetical protein
MKRFSTLDTLEQEGAAVDGSTNGLGLYKFIETENEKIIADAKSDVDVYRADAKSGMDKYKDEMEDYLKKMQQAEIPKKPVQPEIKPAPQIRDAVKVPENLSRYVNFLHPWMHEILNQIVLMLMFFMLVIATLIVLRLQDIG